MSSQLIKAAADNLASTCVYNSVPKAATKIAAAVDGQKVAFDISNATTYGLAGAGIGGLGAYALSRLSGRKGSGLTEALLGAIAGGLGGGAYGGWKPEVDTAIGNAIVPKPAESSLGSSKADSIKKLNEYTAKARTALGKKENLRTLVDTASDDDIRAAAAGLEKELGNAAPSGLSPFDEKYGVKPTGTLLEMLTPGSTAAASVGAGAAAMAGAGALSRWRERHNIARENSRDMANVQAALQNRRAPRGQILRTSLLDSDNGDLRKAIDAWRLARKEPAAALEAIKDQRRAARNSINRAPTVDPSYAVDDALREPAAKLEERQRAIDYALEDAPLPNGSEKEVGNAAAAAAGLRAKEDVRDRLPLHASPDTVKRISAAGLRKFDDVTKQNAAIPAGGKNNKKLIPELEQVKAEQKTRDDIKKEKADIRAAMREARREAVADRNAAVSKHLDAAAKHTREQSVIDDQLIDLMERGDAVRSREIATAANTRSNALREANDVARNAIRELMKNTQLKNPDAELRAAIETARKNRHAAVHNSSSDVRTAIQTARTNKVNRQANYDNGNLIARFTPGHTPTGTNPLPGARAWRTGVVGTGLATAAATAVLKKMTDNRSKFDADTGANEARPFAQDILKKLNPQE